MIPFASMSVRAYSSAIIRAANSFFRNQHRGRFEDGERGPQLQFFFPDRKLMHSTMRNHRHNEVREHPGAC
jgi:hypothetical protein